MNKQTKILMSALTVGVYALVMFTAAGFFYNSYQELIRTCGHYSYSDCYANDGIVVSSVSLKIGTGVFALMGAAAWMIASYVGIRWVRMRGITQLP